MEYPNRLQKMEKKWKLEKGVTRVTDRMRNMSIIIECMHGWIYNEHYGWWVGFYMALQGIINVVPIMQVLHPRIFVLK